MDAKKMRVGRIVDIGAPLLNPKASAGPIHFETKCPVDQNFNFNAMTVEGNKHLLLQNIRVESSNGGNKAVHDDLNPGWSDDEDDGAKPPMVVAADKPKVEIKNGEKPATIVSFKYSHPLRVGRIVDVSPTFPKKDAFKNADRFLPDLKPQVNAVQPTAYGMNQSLFGQNSNGREVFKNGQKKDEEKVVPVGASHPQIVPTSKDRTDAGVRLYNTVASLKRSGDVVNSANTCGDMSSESLLDKSFIDEKVKDAAIYGSTTFTNEEMRRLAMFAKKALNLYTGISDLLIGKAWN
uniref:Uncharacterized protein n=1 Tax=Ditylenchus dipsaci TaxID=166011 RepID=A0A915DKY0_9BILA